MTIDPLPVSALYRPTDLKALKFKTTRELDDVDTLIGQDRALEAVRFGARMRARGYNIFVIGPKGSGKHMAVRTYLTQRASNLPQPDDWVYVTNFADVNQPKALRLRTGGARELHQRMARLVGNVKDSARTVFEGDEYRQAREGLEKSFAERGERVMMEVAEEADKRDLVLIRSPQGMAIAPRLDGKPMPQEHFETLTEAVREKTVEMIKEVQELLSAALHSVPALERERQRALRKLNRRFAQVLIESEIAELRAGWTIDPMVDAWLLTAHDDLVENIRLFVEEEAPSPGMTSQESANPIDPLKRYAINLMVGEARDGSAPVIIEDHPTLGRLVGRIGHRAHMGAMLTDFTMIQPGALHRANGGYLLIDAQKLLTQPHSWEELKRALYADQIAIEGPWETVGTAFAVSMQPQPIPLSVKVVLFGDLRLFMMLSAMDPDFGDLFKVAADFDELMDRDEEHDALYAKMIATVQRRGKLRPFDRAAVERVIEHCSRVVADAERLTARVGIIADVLREADYMGRDKNHKVIRAQDVEDALSAQRHRFDRIEQRSREQILRETMLIDTEGSVVGQVNGLSVMQIGSTSFGKPTRITARVRMGSGKFVDIEREVELAGPLHSKGMLILQGYLAAHYAKDVPVSLQASIVFEQSYGGVDGDSASSTELYALLSALSELPIDQGIAVTGSVNQMGQVQAIGGVNEKIEGFFDICKARGLTGSQGVMVPAANASNLMLKSEVRAAVKAKKFRIWTVSTIAEGIEVLIGVPAGERGGDGAFPEGTVNRLAEDRLIAFAEARRRFGRPGEAP
ncbi:MAG: ATP-binding protein [Proteobacteria bacterium]|nr:ATP-binding protein [Pseudomonadota bacterium]